MADTGLIVIANETRRGLCLTCKHVHKFIVAGALNTEDEDVEQFLCKERYIATCVMKSALRNRSATCPHPDAERAIRWNMAKLDEAPGCEMEQSASPSQEEQARIRQAEAAALARSRPMPTAPRGGGSAVFTVYD